MGSRSREDDGEATAAQSKENLEEPEPDSSENLPNGEAATVMEEGDNNENGDKLGKNPRNPINESMPTQKERINEDVTGKNLLEENIMHSVRNLKLKGKETEDVNAEWKNLIYEGDVSFPKRDENPMMSKAPFNGHVKAGSNGIIHACKKINHDVVGDSATRGHVDDVAPIYGKGQPRVHQS